MPQFIGPVISWIGSVASSVFGGGAAVGGVTAVGTGGGIAGGIGAIGTGITVGTQGVAAASIWASVGNVALNLALSTAVGVVFKPNVASTGGMPVDFKTDPQGPVPFWIGRTGSGGSAVHCEAFGGDKARFLRFIVVLSGAGPIEGVESFHANEIDETFDGARNAEVYYHNVMYMDYKLGAQPETVHTVSIPPWGSTPSAVWDADHKLSGIATAQWILRSNETKYSTGVPRSIWVASGPAVYDPREDSTVPGGSGSQRADDPDTWTFAGNQNPFLHGLTWCLGHRSNGKVVFGAGVPAEGINLQAFIEGANVCDANEWKVGGIAYSTEDKWQVLTAMLRAGGGKPMVLGSAIHCTVQTPKVSIATLTAEDVEGELTLAGFPGRRDRINTAFPRYREEDQEWQIVQAAAVSITDLVTEDGETRSREIDFPLVQDVSQASQLAAYDVLDTRELASATFSLPIRWYGLKPGDCITLDDEVFGGSYKLVIQQREVDLFDSRITLTCRGETDDKHEIALDIVGTAPDPLPDPDPDTDTGYPTALNAEAEAPDVAISWRNPTIGDFAYAKLWRDSDSGFTGATEISDPTFGLPGAPGSIGSFTDTPGTGTWYYWVGAYDVSDLLAGIIGPVSATT